jgi:hypothetical protein
MPAGKHARKEKATERPKLFELHVTRAPILIYQPQEDLRMGEARTKECNRERHHNDKLDPHMLNNGDKRTEYQDATHNAKCDSSRGPGTLLPGSNG